MPAWVSCLVATSLSVDPIGCFGLCQLPSAFDVSLSKHQFRLRRANHCPPPLTYRSIFETRPCMYGVSEACLLACQPTSVSRKKDGRFSKGHGLVRLNLYRPLGLSSLSGMAGPFSQVLASAWQDSCFVGRTRLTYSRPKAVCKSDSLASEFDGPDIGLTKPFLDNKDRTRL